MLFRSPQNPKTPKPQNPNTWRRKGYIFKKNYNQLILIILALPVQSETTMQVSYSNYHQSVTEQASIKLSLLTGRENARHSSADRQAACEKQSICDGSFLDRGSLERSRSRASTDDSAGDEELAQCLLFSKSSSSHESSSSMREEVHCSEFPENLILIESALSREGSSSSSAESKTGGSEELRMLLEAEEELNSIWARRTNKEATATLSTRPLARPVVS